MKKKYYISLTRGLQGYYVLVVAEREEFAREYANRYLSNIYCSIYDTSELEELSDEGYKTVVINEQAPIILNDPDDYYVLDHPLTFDEFTDSVEGI